LYVAKNEGITAAEEALHVIGQKADGAMRDALSIFDQIVSLSGKAVSYKDVIDNLNVLDYEYYFKTIDGALHGDVSTVLLTFNEILEKGFDGHNFISGLNSHLRDLLVSKDETTLSLLEATPAVKKKYMQQTADCSVDFLFRALETGSSCDLSYKSSKNPRLHVELALIRLCRLIDDQPDITEKKKSDRKQLNYDSEELQLPSKSEIIRQEEKPVEKKIIVPEVPVGKHEPVIERPSKAFSIKDLISDENGRVEKVLENAEVVVKEDLKLPRKELTPEAFDSAWLEFNELLKGEGTRIVSMFKTIKPEFENDQTIKIHLSNAAQKDTFVLNYKQRLISFLENRFDVPSIDIETTIDHVETTDILYTDEQKSSYLFNKYPILKEMKKTFNLDIV
jgi:DNA polymerase-3 subunit gamma/tau